MIIAMFKVHLVCCSQHKTSTGLVPTSPRKLNDIARLIQKKPIDYAILQAQMSDKRVAKTRVKSMLCLARDHAVAKGLDREKLVVQRAWVTKGVYLKRLDIKGRGRFGVKMRPEWVHIIYERATLVLTDHAFTFLSDCLQITSTCGTRTRTIKS